MKRIPVSLFAVAVLCGVSLAQDPTPSPSSSPTPQEQQAPATTPQPQAAPEPSTSPTPGSPSAQPNAQSPEQTRQAPQIPQPAPPATQQNPQPRSGNPSQSASASRIAPGSVIPVELTKSIDAKKVKTGDEVVAKVTMDLKTNSGEIVVPKDTKVVGHVTEAQARSKEQKDSQVGIIFDRAVMNGREMQMPMSIQAIIAPQNPSSNANNNNDQPAAPSASASGASSNGGRAPGMGGGTPPPTPTASIGNTPTDASTGANSHEPITGKTEGVVGLRDLKLATTAPDASRGSVVSSEKNNVKLESGTFMLLRVNQ